jgi:glutamine synthetase adenylyltransferase
MKELEMLREKLNSGIELSESEKRRLKELEEEEINRKWKELEELRKKHKNGTLTDEERRRLEELE